MKIKLDEKHYLNSDKFCYWITCDCKYEEGENKGKTYERRVSGYTVTIEQAVDSYINSHVRSLEVEKITKLAEEIKKLKRTVKSWKVVLEK